MGANDQDFSQVFGDEITDKWPNVNPDAVEAETGAGSQKAWTDADGTVFDPDQHVWDQEHNQPKFTQKGRFKKRPRKKSKTESAAGASQVNTETVDNSKKVNEHGTQQAAEITVQLIGAAGRYIAPEQPPFMQDEQGQGEYKSGVEAWKACYDYYGVDYVPPYLAPTIWTFSYFARRIKESEKAQSKFKAAAVYIRSRIGSLFGGKRKRRATHARDDMRDDGER